MLGSFILSCSIHPRFFRVIMRLTKSLHLLQEMSLIVRTRKDAKSEFSLNDAIYSCGTESTESKYF